MKKNVSRRTVSGVCGICNFCPKHDYIPMRLGIFRLLSKKKVMTKNFHVRKNVGKLITKSVTNSNCKFSGYRPTIYKFSPFYTRSDFNLLNSSIIQYQRTFTNRKILTLLVHKYNKNKVNNGTISTR